MYSVPTLTHRFVYRTMLRMIGHYEITRDDDIIRVWSSSEFNLEAAQMYNIDMMTMIEQMPPKFATLVCFDSPPIIAPEVEEAMRQSALQRARRGLAAVAFVTQNQDGIIVANAQWSRIYEGSGIGLQFFQEVDPARAWLQEQLDLKNNPQ